MRRYWLLIGTGLLVAFVAVAALACGGGQPSAEEARAQLCSDIVELDTAVAGVQGLTASSTVEEAEQASDDVTDAFNKVRNSANDVANASLDSLNNAYNDLARAIQDLSGGASLEEASTSISTDVAALADAYEQLFADLNCGQ